MLEKKALNLDASVPRISALVLMDSEGKRIAVDYFTDKLYVWDEWRHPSSPETAALFQSRSSFNCPSEIALTRRCSLSPQPFEHPAPGGVGSDLVQ